MHLGNQFVRVNLEVARGNLLEADVIYPNSSLSSTWIIACETLATPRINNGLFDIKKRLWIQNSEWSFQF